MTAVSEASVHKTSYDRASCNIGIVHLGYGAFHRAHQAVFVDDYMHATGDLVWGIAAVNLRASESPAFIKSSDVNEGYLLKTTSADGDRNYRLVRSHLQFLDWANDRDAAENMIADKHVHAITITITESGYCLADDGSLNATDPVIRAELRGGHGTSIYAYLAGALERRKQTTGLPVSILCCDNIRSNGKMLRGNFTAYLKLAGRGELAEWVDQNVSFPCSMVDRITPRATDQLRSEIQALAPDFADDPVHGEAFIQWVVEDNFAGPMPDLTRAGVEIVADVDPYEETKIRILNGGHTSLAYLGALNGYDTFDEAMHDPHLRAHFDGWQTNEVLPGITIDLPFDKAVYRDEVAARFENQAIADTIERICMDGFSKFPLFVTPTLASCLAQGISPKFGYATIASWYVYAREFAAGRLKSRYVEPAWASLEPLLADGQVDTFARHPQLWGTLPEQHPEFTTGIANAIKKLEKQWPA